MEYLDGHDAKQCYLVVAETEGVILALRPLCVLIGSSLMAGMRIRSTSRGGDKSPAQLKCTWPQIKFEVVKPTYVSTQVGRPVSLHHLSEELPAHIAHLMVQLIAQRVPDNLLTVKPKDLGEFIKQHYAEKFQQIIIKLKAAGLTGIKKK